MAIRYNLRQEAHADITDLLKVDPAAIKQAAEALAQHKPAVISASLLLELTSKSISDKTQAIAVLRQAMVIAELVRSRQTEISEVVEEVIESYFGSEFTPDLLESNRPVIEALTALISVKHVWTSAKAITLSFAYPNIFRDSVIISDIRPVFTDDKSEIIGLISVQELHLEYLDNGRPSEVVLAMDIDDIERLLKSCQDALKKVNTVKTFGAQKCQVPMIVSGDETYGFRN